MDRAQHYLALGRKAGLLITGEDLCRDAAHSGKARLLLLASDASPNAQKRASDALMGHRAPLRTLPWQKAELSALLGRRGCSMVCFTDLGLAATFAAAMAETDPGWRETADALSSHQEKIKRRKAEKRKEHPTDIGGRNDGT